MTEFQARDAVENRRRRRRMMEEEEEYFSSSPPRGMMMVARSSNVHANGLHLHRPSSTTTATLLGTSLDETEVGGNFSKLFLCEKYNFVLKKMSLWCD